VEDAQEFNSQRGESHEAACHVELGVLGASFLLNPVSTRLETR
jgi:hypothetical protein